MVLNEETVKQALCQAAETLNSDYPNVALTDLFIQIDNEKFLLTIYDDEDHLLFSEEIDEPEKENGKISSGTLKTIKQTVNTLHNEQFFNRVNLLNPFSVLLVDQSFAVIQELLTIDSEQIALNEDLLRNWEEELNTFMENLLSQEEE